MSVLKFSVCRYFASLIRFIPKYFCCYYCCYINGMVFLICFLANLQSNGYGSHYIPRIKGMVVTHLTH
jgi:hypothetical protein